MRNQYGNVLFMILIAVVLFAALSYAVTQSSRGGGSADSEIATIQISELLQQATTYKTEFVRRNISGKDLTLNEGAGEFLEPGEGAPRLLSPQDITTNSWVLYKRRVTLDGQVLGTQDFDYVIGVSINSQEICSEINRQLHGNTSTNLYSGFDNNAGEFSEMAYIWTDGTIIPNMHINEGLALTNTPPPACYAVTGCQCMWEYFDVAIQN